MGYYGLEAWAVGVVVSGEDVDVVISSEGDVGGVEGASGVAGVVADWDSAVSVG